MNLAKERQAVAKARHAGKTKRRKRANAVDANRAVSPKGPATGPPGHEGRRQIKALQEEGALLESFADEPMGEVHVSHLLFQVQLLAGAAAGLDKRADDARAHFRQAVEARPDRAEGWYRLGQHALESKDPKAARAHFEAAVGAEPDNALGWAGLLELARSADDKPAQRRLAAVVRRLAPGHPSLESRPGKP